MAELTIPKVAESFDDKKAGERVDRALSVLSSQLRQSGVTGGSDITDAINDSKIIANGFFFHTFESAISSWNLRQGSVAGVTYENNGQAGGKAFRSTKGVWLAYPSNIPFDPDRLYRIRTRVRKISGADAACLVGVEGIAADGITLVDRNGSTSYNTMHEVGLDATISSTSWVTYEGYFKGVAATGTASSPSTDASAPRLLQEDVRYIRPFFALDTALGDLSVIEIDYISLEILTETPEVNVLAEEVGGRSVTTIASTIESSGDIADNKVGGGSVKTGAISGGGTGGKNHIEAGSIVAANIKAYTIQAGQLGSLTGAGLTINFAATGSNPVLNHSKFYILADGTAAFAGTVSATSFTGSTSTFVDGSANAVDITGDMIKFGNYQSLGPKLYVGIGSTPQIKTYEYTLGAGANLTLSVPSSSLIIMGGDTKFNGYIGFFSSTPVGKTSVSAPASMITISGTGDDANINTNFNRLYTTLAALQSSLNSYNLV